MSFLSILSLKKYIICIGFDVEIRENKTADLNLLILVNEIAFVSGLSWEDTTIHETIWRLGVRRVVNLLFNCRDVDN